MMKGVKRVMFVLEKRWFWEAAQCYCIAVLPAFNNKIQKYII
jgi:hypothetical protein